MNFNIRILQFSLAIATVGIFSSCAGRMAQAIRPESIPSDVRNYTLMVENYQEKDPTVFSPFIAVNTDSLKEITKFKYAAEELENLNIPTEREHPLIIETNNNLEKYNKELEEIMAKNYHGDYVLVNDENILAVNHQLHKEDSITTEGGAIGGMNELNADIAQFKYALVRKPVMHCYIDPKSVTQMSYRYLYYFQDIETGKTYPEIEVYSPDPNKTLKAIVYKINKMHK